PARRRPEYATSHDRRGRSGRRSWTSRYRARSQDRAGTQALLPRRAIARFHPSEFSPPVDILGLPILQDEEVLARRTQIDFGQIAFEDSVVNDEMFERVELLLPAGIGKLHDYTIVQDEVPAPVRHELIDLDPGRNGAMHRDGVDDIGGSLRGAVAGQMRKLREVLHIVVRDGLAGALHHDEAVVRFPECEGQFLDDMDVERIWVAPLHIGIGNPI